jgi:hypothetical protein
MNEPQYNPKLTGIQNFKIAFEKGKLEEREKFIKMFQDYLDDLYFCKFDEIKFYASLRYKRDMKIKFKEIFDVWIEKNEQFKKQLQKEIGDNSQTEQNSDKEVAQPYSKSDKTTKEIREEKQDE